MPTDPKGAGYFAEELPELVLVLGKTGVGKSTFIQAATGLDVEIGDSLKSCTAEVQIYPVADSRIFIIDTPGFDDSGRSDTEILQSIASCLADIHEGLGFPDVMVTLSGIVYIHSISEGRMTGTMMKNLRMFQLLVGQENMQHCVLVTSKWGLEGLGIAERRESELVQNADYWGRLLAAGASISRFQDSQSSATEIIELCKSAGAFFPQLTREYAIEGMDLHQTAAGRAIDEDLAKALERHRRDLDKWRREHSDALERDDVRTAAELGALSLEAESKLETLHEETEWLRANRDLAQNRMDNSDAESSYTGFDDAEERHQARQKRALRWFARFIAMGAAVTMTVLTHGAMAPVGIRLYAAVETVCQADKDRDAKRRKTRLLLEAKSI